MITTGNFLHFTYLKKTNPIVHLTYKICAIFIITYFLIFIYR